MKILWVQKIVGEFEGFFGYPHFKFILRNLILLNFWWLKNYWNFLNLWIKNKIFYFSKFSSFSLSFIWRSYLFSLFRKILSRLVLLSIIIILFRSWRSRDAKRILFFSLQSFNPYCKQLCLRLNVARLLKNDGGNSLDRWSCV